MTRKEAIKYLNEFIFFKKISNTTEGEVVECFKLAVEALQEHQHYKDLAESYEKTINKLTKAIAEPQPNEDCISRQAVDDAIYDYSRSCDANYQQIMEFIDKISSITPQPKTEEQQKTGHWIEHKHGGIEHIECSECGVWFLKANLIRKSYCPNCGSCNGDMIKNIMRDITKQ